ncbi:hypothetical protein AADG42_14515 [Ammonicoccus fulvus]|uniref:Uncharacterized protein n=1 Tax=Ammonicoccus fulvus TaxID=3138240 RepID=A0ABZ3FQU6_9ACTN
MRKDPLQNLPGFRTGVRVSMRIVDHDGAADRLGLVLEVDDDSVVVENRAGEQERIDRSTIRLAKLVPTVARGRNPRHAPRELLEALAHDAVLGAPAGSACWIARLGEVVDHLDDAGVRPVPGQSDTRTAAGRGESRGLVNGEWAAVRLAAAEDFDALAAWAARRNARNVVVTSGLSEEALSNLGLERL